jgi:ATP phosphoribosyltransferase
VVCRHGTSRVPLGHLWRPAFPTPDVPVIHPVQVKRAESSSKMDELQAVGATDILLFPISNSRM